MNLISSRSQARRQRSRGPAHPSRSDSRFLSKGSALDRHAENKRMPRDGYFDGHSCHLTDRNEVGGAMELPAQLQTGDAHFVQVRKRGWAQARTIGFPSFRTERKCVKFDPEFAAKCISIDGIRSNNCLVVSVWDGGARAKLMWSRHLTEFFLAFTSSVKLVYRRCKRVRLRGEEIEVEYQRKPPSSALDAETVPEPAPRA
ncbi:hypothetical protein V1289_003310 [Bradyrhizobium sp. AZCC 2289]